MYIEGPNATLRSKLLSLEIVINAINSDTPPKKHATVGKKPSPEATINNKWMSSDDDDQGGDSIEYKQLDSDESYELNITSNNAVITARTV